MARWLERLQEFDFVIVHRRTLTLTHCHDSRAVNVAERASSVIATTSLATPVDMSQEQLQDPIIGPVLQAKLQDKKPPEKQIKSLSRPTRRLFQIWMQLSIHNGQLYRQYQKDTSDRSPSLIPQLACKSCTKWTG